MASDWHVKMIVTQLRENYAVKQTDRIVQS